MSTQHNKTNKITLTVKEACALTGLSQASVFHLFTIGKLTRRKLGSKTLILSSELVTLMENLPSDDTSLRARAASEAT